MRKGIKKGLGITGFVALLGTLVGIHQCVSYCDYNQALRYPGYYLGFVWKLRYEDNFNNCLAKNNPKHYQENPSGYIVREYCIHHSHVVGGDTIEQGECRSFRVNRDCIDHFVAESRER